ncbi:TetR/AcrR family transcriptional regulator [Spiractinospora alimapuensis]|uniref:TetR/AcrR family transcriptional regulator n=1 Tax=Spiractinospora alimapuensis TaxID=2820884 RepID=UPI001F3270F2|nr:TetR/AcrR family transcriptional regulator [Spiractinospora alimapuensis]QVQ51564.1 TetR/AcrR family transcriptional regulator [Spiractinospora alimapuensis]
MAKRVDADERRELILDAAVRVFARQGFAATRMEDIAREVGVAKGTVYLSFTNQDALLEAVFSSYASRAREVLESVGDGPPLVRLERLLRSVVAMLASAPDHAQVVLDLQGTGLSLNMAAIYRAYRDRIAELLRDALSEGALRPGVGEGHAAVIIGAVEGCLLQRLADPAVELADLAEPIIDLCVEGIRA